MDITGGGRWATVRVNNLIIQRSSINTVYTIAKTILVIDAAIRTFKTSKYQHMYVYVCVRLSWPRCSLCN